MSCEGFHSAISLPISAKRVALSSAATVASGCAIRTSRSPTATPIRFSPKSNASTVVLKGSGVSCGVRELRVIDAEEAHCGGGPRVGGKIEDHFGLGVDGEPRVLRELMLELPRRPAGVAERDEYLPRSFVAPDGFEDVFRRGEAHVGRNLQRRLPRAQRRVQHET